MAVLGWSLPQSLAATGASCAYVGWAGRVRGCFAFADTPVPEAKEVIATLHDQRLQTLLLSGDAQEVVAQVAATLAVPQWQAQLLPEDKVRLLRAWIHRHGPVAMVGDGLNDGPVLAAASVGIAVGAASDLAKESADVVLPRGGLACLPWLLQQAARARRSLHANLIWAFAYNAVALSLAASALLQPAIAAALMAGSSLLIALRSWHASRRDDAAGAPRPAPMTTGAATIVARLPRKASSVERKSGSGVERGSRWTLDSCFSEFGAHESSPFLTAEAPRPRRTPQESIPQRPPHLCGEEGSEAEPR
jgi:Cu2+-exporting ATPase